MSPSPKESTPILLYLFVLVTLGMLVVALYYTFEAFIALQGGTDSGATYQLITGLFGVLVSVYMFMQFRRRMTLVKSSVPRSMITIVECRKCGLKNLRTFAKGDFMFKTVENCQKCSEPMFITGIYAEKVKK